MIVRDIDSFDALAAFFGDDKRYPGWVEVQWSRPTGAALDGVVERLKALKLTFRNVPLDAEPADGACLFTGEHSGRAHPGGTRLLGRSSFDSLFPCDGGRGDYSDGPMAKIDPY